MQQHWLVLLFQLLTLEPILNHALCPMCTHYRRVELQLQPQAIEQCPCVKAPGSNECLSYDNRLQAASIDEALHTFPDLSSVTENARPLVSEEQNTFRVTSFKSAFGFSASYEKTYRAPTKYTCDTKECQACKLLITNAFIKANGNNFLTTDSTAIQMPSDIDESLCFKNKPVLKNVFRDAVENGTIMQELPPYLEEVISLLTPKVRKRSNRKEMKQKLLGVATTIGCNYKKGAEISHGWTGLCNLCWQWRKLPADYFPVLLNEVSCDSSDEGCLSGFGNCRPIMRSISVLRNVATQKSPRWVQESINTISACECQVEMGTPLHALVLR